MPLRTIGAYLPMMQEFLAHWKSVNAELGGTPETEIKLQGGFTWAMFLALQAELEAADTDVVHWETERSLAASDRGKMKTKMLGRINQFRGLLRALLPNSIYASSAPRAPNISAAESKFLAPFDDLAGQWECINADTTIPGFTPPLLIGTLTQAAFVTELAELRAAYAAVGAAENNLDLARKRRDALLPLARERMLQYRELLPALLGADHHLSQTLPRITPHARKKPSPA